MGEQKPKRGFNRPQQNQQAAALSSRPFTKLRGLKVGPGCLVCDQPIDVRRNNGQGWVHNRCETKGKVVIFQVKDEEGNIHLVPADRVEVAGG